MESKESQSNTEQTVSDVEKINPLLETPAESYKDSYLEALKEFQAEGRNVNESVEELERDFPAFVNRIIGEAEGRNLPDGYVPQTTLWLVDDAEYIGRVGIRHQLNENLLKTGGNIGYEIRPSKRGRGYGSEILELALPKAKELGLNRVLLTCDSTNTASKKIIEKAGGVLENEVSGEEGKPSKLRYWIELGE